MSSISAYNSLDFHPGTLIPESWYRGAQSLGKAIDNHNPLRPYQERLDELISMYISPYLPKSKEELDQVQSLNIWDRINIVLDDQHKTETKTVQVLFFCILLIPRVLRNVVGLVYNVLRLLGQFCIHPLETLASAVVFLSKVILALKNPKLLSSAGAGCIGAGFGQGIITPQAIIIFIIGASLIGTGVIYGALKTAIEADKGRKWESVAQQFEEQILDLPEMFLTGFLLGITLGVAQVALSIPTNNPSSQILGLADDVQPCLKSTSNTGYEQLQ